MRPLRIVEGCEILGEGGAFGVYQRPDAARLVVVRCRRWCGHPGESPALGCSGAVVAVDPGVRGLGAGLAFTGKPNSSWKKRRARGASGVEMSNQAGPYGW